jgi:hypothetical protein
MQCVAKRVFHALEKWVYGKGGRPRFKGVQRRLHSIEGKNKTGMLQWKSDQKVLQVQRGWVIPVILPELGKNEWLWEALQSVTKYCRALWRMVNRVKRWYMQRRLTYKLLSKALHWKDDGVSSKSMQRNYGKSTGKCAPGMLMSTLTRKAERAAGSRTIIDIRSLKTSQYDHASDTFVKKRLSQRLHVFGDGRGSVQRDVYSAFLALHAEGNKHDPLRLETAWAALESTLCGAGLCVVNKLRVGGSAGPRDSSISPERFARQPWRMRSGC